MKKLFIETFLSVDMLSDYVTFEFNNQKKYKSIFGSIVTSLIIATTFVIGMLFGEDIYNKAHPNLVTSLQYSNNTKIMMKDFPFFFQITNTLGQDDPNILKYIYFVFTKFEIFANNTIIYTPFYANAKICDKTYYDRYDHIIGENRQYLESGKMFCFDLKDDDYLLNEWPSPNSVHYNIGVRQCHTNNDTCREEDKNQYLNGIFISFTHIDYIINSNDYKNPIQSTVLRHALQTGLGFTKVMFLSLINVNFDMDNGLLLQDSQSITFNRFYSTRNDFTRYTSGPQADILYYLVLDTPRLRENYVRSYMKLQELVARIGGFFNFFYLLGRILLYHFNKYSFLLKMDNIVNVIINKNDNSNKKIDLKKSIYLDCSHLGIDLENRNKKDLYSKPNHILNKVLELELKHPQLNYSNYLKYIFTCNKNKKIVEQKMNSMRKYLSFAHYIKNCILLEELNRTMQSIGSNNININPSLINENPKNSNMELSLNLVSVLPLQLNPRKAEEDIN